MTPLKKLRNYTKTNIEYMETSMQHIIISKLRKEGMNL